MFMNGDKFEGLLGKTLIDIQNIDNEELIFTVDDGTQYKLYHDQDCCEVVRIVDIDGDLNDLLNMPILRAEEVTHEQETPEDAPILEYYDDSFTWTFYKLATNRASVTIRWLGESNGYYSESVEFVKTRKEREA